MEAEAVANDASNFRCGLAGSWSAEDGKGPACDHHVRALIVEMAVFLPGESARFPPIYREPDTVFKFDQLLITEPFFCPSVVGL